ncbi:MAG: hypothetical protein PHD29_05075 [bacterium]|nr:hypothetical protein [bacterium]MDD5353725.1 hypothetical protein [bacterium]MDD5755887.1 hypothetical protein [bacterium]
MECKKIQRSLVNYYYQELDSPAMSKIAGHLETCVACRQTYGQIKKTLTLVAKEQVEKEKSSFFWQDFQHQVYQAVSAEKESLSRWRGFLAPRRLVPALAGALILLLIIISSPRWSRHGSEMTSADLPIVQELELIENYELIQDLELLENLQEAEQLRG